MAGRLRGLCRLASAAGRRVVQNEAYSNNAAAGSLQQVPLRFELYSADFQAMTEEARVYKATYRQIRQSIVVDRLGPTLSPPKIYAAVPLALSMHLRSSHAITRSFASGSATAPDITAEYEHATGLEKVELERAMKGVDPWHEPWLDAPFGTAEAPVEVPSSYANRVVGVPDPDDDSLVWWGLIEEGDPPKQIVENGEYFVLKREISESGDHH